jgi:hypothetical protein
MLRKEEMGKVPIQNRLLKGARLYFLIASWHWQSVIFDRMCITFTISKTDGEK